MFIPCKNLYMNCYVFGCFNKLVLLFVFFFITFFSTPEEKKAGMFIKLTMKLGITFYCKGHIILNALQ